MKLTTQVWVVLALFCVMLGTAGIVGAALGQSGHTVYIAGMR